ncbi:hypothetical protein BRC82_02930 [Halobacteriales archaeon QS_1_67_19]|nr:MAG: hypothetical protein BRC82_02930 [Halobacteriales archaeon QS_1_67_19]
MDPGEQAELNEELETAEERLDAFAERDRTDRGGIVDEIDNQLLRLEERVDDGAAARSIQSARNRLHIYRENREAIDDNLAVVESAVRPRDRDAEGAVLPVGEVTLTATVANTGEATEVVSTVTFYDEDGDELESVRGPEFFIEAGGQETVEFSPDVPSDAAAYAVSVADTGGVREGGPV